MFRCSFFYAPILGNSFAGETFVLRVSLQKTVKHQPASHHQRAMTCLCRGKNCVRSIPPKDSKTPTSHHQRAMACNLSPRKVSVLSEVNISIYNISDIVGSWMYDRSRYMNNRWSEGINHREKVPFPNRKFHSSVENWPKLVNKDALEDIPFVPFEHVMFSYVFILICFPLLAMIGIGQQSGLGVCGRSRWTSRSFHTSTEWLGSHKRPIMRSLAISRPQTGLVLFSGGSIWHMAYGGGIHVIPCYLSNHPHIISTSTQKFHSCTFQAAEFTWSLPEQEN